MILFTMDYQNHSGKNKDYINSKKKIINLF